MVKSIKYRKGKDHLSQKNKNVQNYNNSEKSVNISVKKIYLFVFRKYMKKTSSASSDISVNFGNNWLDRDKEDLLLNLQNDDIKQSYNAVLVLEDFQSGTIEQCSQKLSVRDIVSQNLGDNAVNIREQDICLTCPASDKENSEIELEGKLITFFKVTKDTTNKTYYNNKTSNEEESKEPQGVEADEKAVSKRNKKYYSNLKDKEGERHCNDPVEEDDKETKVKEEVEGDGLGESFSEEMSCNIRYIGDTESWPMSSVEKGHVFIGSTKTRFTHSTNKTVKSNPNGLITSSAIPNEEVLKELLVFTFNMLRNKGIFRDKVSIPPHVIDPMSTNFEFTLKDFESVSRTPIYDMPVSPRNFNNLMATIFQRLSTFSNWPLDAPFSAVRLVDAGFYYDSSRNVIICFLCGCEVDCNRQLRECASRQITALQLHAAIYPDCEYAKNEPQNHDNIDELDSLQPDTDSIERAINGAHQNEENNLQLATPRLISNTSHQNNYAIRGIVSNSQDSTYLENREIASPSDVYASNLARVSGHKETKDNMFGSIQNKVPSQNNNDQDSLSQYFSDFDNNRARNDNKVTMTQTFVNNLEFSYSLKHPEYKDINSRLESYRSWSITEVQSPPNLIVAGFFYTGKRDIVRCFCCDIGLAEWEDDDDPWVEHARHSPNCKYLKEKQGEEYIISIQSEWRKIYNPKHPMYEDLQARRDTYDGWPEELIQEPEVLAAAGFFYTGQNDVVRCHYCDGGLREWEPQDEPWTEHARWFPFCKYLMKVKGLEFIEGVARVHASRYIEQATNQSDQLNAISAEFSLTNQQQLIPETDLINTLAAETLMAMGYTQYGVKFIINKFLQLNGRTDFNAEDLMNIVMYLEDNGETIPSAPINNDPASALNGINSGNSTEMLDPQAVQRENKRLKDQMLCTKCKTFDKNMLFVPCGHRLFCESCSKSVKMCPVCYKRVKKIVKTFLA